VSGADYGSGWSDQRAARQSATRLVAPVLLVVGLLMIGIWWWYHSHHRSGTVASRLVLQRGDVPGYRVKSSYAKKGASLPGLVSGYTVFYALKDPRQLNYSLLAIGSSVSIFKTTTAAHAALQTQALLIRAAHLTRFAPPALGTETLFWVTGRGRTSWLAWRSGRILATVATIGVEPGRRLKTVRFGELMQTRIAGAT
jgi:hypothetical protein